MPNISYAPRHRARRPAARRPIAGRTDFPAPAVIPPVGNPFDEYCLERLKAADTLLLGRNSYVAFKSFWPQVNGDPNFSKTKQEISRLDNELDKVVISNSLAEDETEPWQDNTRIIKRKDAHEALAKLKRKRNGGDILMFGSRTLWNDLFVHGLVDEMHLVVGSVLLGGGTRIIESKPEHPLHLIATRTWDESDTLLVRYGVDNKAA